LSEVRRPQALLMIRVPSRPHLSDRCWTTLSRQDAGFIDAWAQPTCGDWEKVSTVDETR
jgi:hypothetical protein